MFYDPRADIVFRKIFCEHKNLCISLLNSLLPIGADEQIEEVEYLDPNMFPEYINEKHSIVDVRCRDQKGNQYIVEMQMYWTDAFLMRALFNASKAFTEQSQQGMEYKELRPVYSLCLLNENMPDTREYKDEYTHTYFIQHELHKELRIGGMTFVFVELKKFHSQNRVFNKMAELWLSFLTCMEGKRAIDEPEIPAELIANPEVCQAIDCLRTMSMTPTERRLYERYWDSISCERTLISASYDEGVADGIEKGEQAKAEGIARNLKTMGMTAEQIAAATGLSIEQIESL